MALSCRLSIFAFVLFALFFIHASAAPDPGISSFAPSPSATPQYYFINNQNVPIVDINDSDQIHAKPKIYSQQNEKFGYRVVLRRAESGELVIHRRQGADEGGASNVRPTSTRFVPNPVSPPVSPPPSRDDDEPSSPPPNPPAIPLISSTFVAPNSAGPSNVPPRSIGGPLITSPSRTPIPTQTGNQSNPNSNIPIIAGVVAGSFALAVAAGGIYIFRKFTLKPSQKFANRLVPDDEQPPSHTPSYPLPPPRNQSPNHSLPKNYSNQGTPMYVKSPAPPMIYTTAPTPEPVTNYAYTPVPVTTYQQSYDSNAYVYQTPNQQYR